VNYHFNMKIQRNLVWSLPGYGRRRRNNDDDDDDGIERYRRNEGGWQKSFHSR
jgi:hypothetical protein